MSDYSRQYTSGVSWENLSSTATPISAGNLNKMDNAILHIDEAAYTAINTKANKTTVNGCINNITFDSTTGVFTITFVDGSTTTINTALEKVVTNFAYSSATQSLVLTLEDGSTQNISLSEFITQYEFESTSTIEFALTDGVISANVKNGSITGEKLNPNYLTQIQSQVISAKDYAKQSQSYALGNAVDDEGDSYREGQTTDNAKYYYQKAHEAASEAGAEPFIGATSSTGGTAGLVPAPMIADREKFLKGDGSWGEVDLSAFTGATSSTAGTKGMVPAPAIGDQEKVLRGDGTWGTLNMSPFTGATANDDGTSGQVPQPLAGDQNKFLTGGGIWTPDTANLTTTFTSSDNATETGIIVASGETSMTALTSGDNHSGLFNVISKVSLNTRKLINTVKRIWNSVGATWVSGHAYKVNDMVVYENGHVYKCKAAHTSSASILPTNTAYWTDTTLAAEIASLNSNYANLTTYSTNEIAIGKWIDGKILYRKVYTLQNPANGTFNFNINGKINEIVHVYGVFRRSDNNWWQSMPSYGSSNVHANLIDFNINATTPIFTVNITGWTANKSIVVFEYTKT